MAGVTDKREEINIGITLTTQDRLGLDRMLVRYLDEIEEIDEARKSSMDDFKAQLKEVKEKMKIIIDQLRSGEKTKKVFAKVEYHPADKVKIYKDIDKGHELKREVMTDDDYQLSMGLDPSPNGEKKDKPEKPK